MPQPHRLRGITATGSSALPWQDGVVARVVDPKPWFQARRDEQLERLNSLLADAATEEERSEIEERIKDVRKEYRRELRRSRPVRW